MRRPGGFFLCGAVAAGAYTLAVRNGLVVMFAGRTKSNLVPRPLFRRYPPGPS
jgi:hypothetical protein